MIYSFIYILQIFYLAKPISTYFGFTALQNSIISFKGTAKYLQIK